MWLHAAFAPHSPGHDLASLPCSRVPRTFLDQQRTVTIGRRFGCGDRPRALLLGVVRAQPPLRPHPDHDRCRRQVLVGELPTFCLAQVPHSDTRSIRASTTGSLLVTSPSAMTYTVGRLFVLDRHGEPAGRANQVVLHRACFHPDPDLAAWLVPVPDRAPTAARDPVVRRRSCQLGVRLDTDPVPRCSIWPRPSQPTRSGRYLRPLRWSCWSGRRESNPRS